VEWIPQIAAGLSSIAKAGGITIVIIVFLWLLFCVWVSRAP
jgi:hypothetical protein